MDGWMGGGGPGRRMKRAPRTKTKTKKTETERMSITNRTLWTITLVGLTPEQQGWAPPSLPHPTQSAPQSSLSTAFNRNHALPQQSPQGQDCSVHTHTHTHTHTSIRKENLLKNQHTHLNKMQKNFITGLYDVKLRVCDKWLIL